LRLTQEPETNGLELCRWIDEEGAADLPDQWKTKPNDRSFESAYMSTAHRSKIQVVISKVRADMVMFVKENLRRDEWQKSGVNSTEAIDRQIC
jgi:hypothetical protein